MKKKNFNDKELKNIPANPSYQVCNNACLFALTDRSNRTNEYSLETSMSGFLFECSDNLCFAFLEKLPSVINRLTFCIFYLVIQSI